MPLPHGGMEALADRLVTYSVVQTLSPGTSSAANYVRSTCAGSEDLFMLLSPVHLMLIHRTIPFYLSVSPVLPQKAIGVKISTVNYCELIF